ncbi:hypothetical protein YT1_1617 [Rhodococcus ruber]|nr:hypothetical protein YT1_1617 [Rhodococcus ruber]
MFRLPRGMAVVIRPAQTDFERRHDEPRLVCTQIGFDECPGGGLAPAWRRTYLSVRRQVRSPHGFRTARIR